MEEKEPNTKKDESKTENISGKVSQRAKDRIDDYCAKAGISVSSGTDIAWNSFLTTIEKDDRRLDLTKNISDSVTYIENMIKSIESQANAKIEQLACSKDEVVADLIRQIEEKRQELTNINLSLEDAKTGLNEANNRVDETNKVIKEKIHELESKDRLIESLNLNIVQYSKVSEENEGFKNEIIDLKEKYQNAHDGIIKYESALKALENQKAIEIEGIRRELELVYQNNTDLKALIEDLKAQNEKLSEVNLVYRDQKGDFEEERGIHNEN